MGFTRKSTRKSAPRALQKSIPKKNKPKYKLSAPVKDGVKKIVDSRLVTKEKLFQCFGTGVGTSYNNHQFSGVPQAVDMMRLFPDIVQGDNREQRVGSRIRLTGLHCRFHFHVPPANTAAAGDTIGNLNASYQCRLLVLSSKQFKLWSELAANWNAGQTLGRKYLRDGESQTWCQGDLYSLQMPVNTALFTTHYDKKFILTRGVVQGSLADGLARVPDAIKTYNINVKVKNKLVRWADASLTTASGYAPFAIILYAPMNGSATDTSPGSVWGNCFTRSNFKNA